MSEGQAGWAVTGGLGGDCCEWPDGCWSRKWKHTHETSSLVSPGLTLTWWWQWEILLTLSWARSAWAKSLWRGAAQWLLLQSSLAQFCYPVGSELGHSVQRMSSSSSDVTPLCPAVSLCCLQNSQHKLEQNYLLERMCFGEFQLSQK